MFYTLDFPELLFMPLFTNRLFSLFAGVALCSMALVGNVYAATVITEEYIAIDFEAEDDESRDLRWYLTEPTTTAIIDPATGEALADPDPNHSDGASGDAYLELLPDDRVTAEDPRTPTNIWDAAGTGPKAFYPIIFPEAGRYYVHVRAFSTGLEDNGLHVGLNDEWPDSGKKMQWCTSGSNEWRWSSSQRDSGGAGSCGTEKTVWITVDEPGEHNFVISAREDGFEADRIMLIKDLTDNTQICSPRQDTSTVQCVADSLEFSDEVSDMAVSSTIDSNSIDIDGSVTLSVRVRNADRWDNANDVVLRLAAQIGTDWEAVGLPEECESASTGVTCELGELHPTENGVALEFEFTFEPLRSGSLEIPVNIETSSADGSTNNDAAGQIIEVMDDNVLTNIVWAWSNTQLNWSIGSETRVLATAINEGPGEAKNVVLSVSLPNGLTITRMPRECTGTREISCNIDVIAMPGRAALDFGVTPEATGMFSISASAGASNLNGPTVDSSVIVSVDDQSSINSTVVTNPTNGNQTSANGNQTSVDAIGVSSGVAVNTGNETSNQMQAGSQAPEPFDMNRIQTSASFDGAGSMAWWTLILLSLSIFIKHVKYACVRKQRVTW